MEQFHGTTILCVRRNGVAAMAGDGQVTLGNIVFKGTTRFWWVLPARPQTLLRSWSDLKESLRSIPAF